MGDSTSTGWRIWFAFLAIAALYGFVMIGDAQRAAEINEAGVLTAQQQTVNGPWQLANADRHHRLRADRRGGGCRFVGLVPDQPRRSADRDREATPRSPRGAGARKEPIGADRSRPNAKRHSGGPTELITHPNGNG